MSSTPEKGAAASKTGNTDYDTAHLGTIYTETQLSLGAKHMRKMGSGECETSHQVLRMQVSVTVHKDREEEMICSMVFY